jgi:threonine aldolase
MFMKTIDLRSDTVTRPTELMRAVMANAEVGDDVCGDDPTVNRLEEIAAEMLGMESAIFAPTGTQSNLIGLLAHCQRGDEYIVGQQAHTYKYEGGGAAVLGSIQPQPLEFEKNGTLDLDKVKNAIKQDDFHFARTKLLCLENSMSGKVLPLDYLEKAAKFAKDNKLKIHLDGARVFNASVYLGIDVREISQHFDSVSICLSKGLGAPVGSLLCGSSELIKEARKWRKMLGGGMRQAGIIAAGGIYALENNINRLSEDHRNAKLLAEGLSEIDELKINVNRVQTNMAFITLKKKTVDELRLFLKSKGILIYDKDPVRLVTHMDFSHEDISSVVQAFKEFFTTN